jgi:hypothetical protein
LTHSSSEDNQRPVFEYLPTDVADDSVGHDLCELADMAGLNLDPWQRWVLVNSMGVQENGLWSAFEAACFVARQNGKGSILEARQLGGLFYLDEPLQVHTSHEFKTTYEHFLRVQNLIEGNRDFEQRVLRVRRGAGEQAIELRSGARLRFLARSGGSGRGLTGDAVYLDETFALTAAMMGALLFTMGARPNPQIWYASSAAHLRSESMHGLVTRIQDGVPGQRFFGADWGIDPDTFHAEMAGDRSLWHRSNPGMGIRLTEEMTQAELDACLSDPEKGLGEFIRERLGIHEIPPNEGVVDLDRWDRLVDVDAKIVSKPSISFEVAADRSYASFGVAGRTEKGLVHVELADRRPGVGWVLDRGTELADRWKVPLRIESSSPAGSFISEFEEAGVKVDSLSPADHAKGVGNLFDWAGIPMDKKTEDEWKRDGYEPTPTLTHSGSPSIRQALKGAVMSSSGDAKKWSRAQSSSETSPLIAVTLALGGVPQVVQVKRKPQVLVR